MRAAIGASPVRLVRAALIDSAALAGIGAAGIAVAWAGARLIVHLAFQDAWVPVSAAPATPVLLFALAVSLMTALIFGVVPAWITSRADPMDAMRGSTRTAAATTGAQKTLAVAQAAVSVVLLSAAAMLGGSLYNLEHHNLGFATDGRYLVAIDSKLSNQPQERLLPLFREIETDSRSFPGVRNVSAALYAPMSGSYWSHDVRIAGQPELAAGDDVSSAWTRVTPSFFETIGDRIVMGTADRRHRQRDHEPRGRDQRTVHETILWARESYWQALRSGRASRRRSSRRSSRHGARRDWIRSGRYASNRVRRNGSCLSGQTQ